MLITVITPTIARASLLTTCQSVDSQSFQDFQHIIALDRPGAGLPQEIFSPRRIVLPCDRPHNNFGNTCRYDAGAVAAGEYVMYCDDDDYFATGALEAIAEALEAHRPQWMIFPSLVQGVRWLNVPPGASKTVSCQFIHKRGPRWPDNGNYAADGELIESLLRDFGMPLVLDCDPLVIVDKSRYGQP